MALLRSSSPDAAPPRAGSGNPAEQHNIIGKGTVIEGTVRSAGNVHVSGTVVGDLDVDGRTVVMPGGLVEGEVRSVSAEIGGTVKGQVRVRERLVLKATAVIEGDLHTQKLVIEDGAVFTGRCEMGAAAAAIPPRPERADAPERSGAPARPTRRLGADQEGEAGLAAQA
jgi:cytoskeletal protein CcmA (bactofilin family)